MMVMLISYSELLLYMMMVTGTQLRSLVSWFVASVALSYVTLHSHDVTAVTLSL